VIRVQQTKLTQKDLDKMYNDLVNDIEKLFAEIKKLVEQEKVAEEQERLKRLQVGDRIYRNSSAVTLATVARCVTYYAGH